MDVREYMRRKVLSDIVSKMSDEDKRAYMLMCNTDNHQEVMQALQSQQEQLTHIAKQGGFWRDFASNVAGNAAFDGAVYLASKLIRLIR